MGKMYTIDGKLLTETPEIRIGDKVYPVDNRVKTVKKVQKLPLENETAVLELALGKQATKEIDDMNLPWPAYSELLQMVVAAMTGEEAEGVKDRFQEAAK